MKEDTIREIRELIEDAQKPLSVLYHCLDYIYDETDNPDLINILNDITEFQDRLNSITVTLHGE